MTPFFCDYVVGDKILWVEGDINTSLTGVIAEVKKLYKNGRIRYEIIRGNRLYHVGETIYTSNLNPPWRRKIDDIQLGIF